MKRAFLLLLFAGIIGGCATAGRKLDDSAVSRIKKGETTRAEVVEWLGSPDNFTRIGDGTTVLTYSYFRASSRPENFIPLVGAFVGGMDTQSQVLVVTCDASDLVSDYAYTMGGSEIYSNLSTGSSADLPEVEDNKRPR